MSRENRLAGKRTLVTGADVGIGRKVAAKADFDNSDEVVPL
jgi:hypothetical protein